MVGCQVTCSPLRVLLVFRVLAGDVFLPTTDARGGGGGVCCKRKARVVIQRGQRSPSPNYAMACSAIVPSASAAGRHHAAIDRWLIWQVGARRLLPGCSRQRGARRACAGGELR